jgi:TonB family protein
MSRITNRGVFNASLLPEAQPRWDLFSAGFGLQIVAVTALVVIPLLMPEKLNIVQRYWTTPIEAPPIVAWKPQPPPPAVKTVAVKEPVKPLPKPAPVPVPVAVELPKPKVYNPVVAAPVVKPVTRKNTSAPEMAEVAKVFPDQAPLSMGSSAVPNIKKPREAVQTGGFGDPDGVKDNGKTNKAANINISGAYDMPAGPGSGNGTGGAKGVKGVTGSAGFGNGVAVGTPGGGSHGTIQTGGFADEHATAGPAKTKQVAAASNTTPVQILFKPKPVYSADGIASKIEGEVLLQVIFTASGEVKVLRVVQGLGHGLDESAETAARQIKFKPAQQQGQAVDQMANIRIAFAMAN